MYMYAVLMMQNVLTCCILLVFLLISFVVSEVSAWVYSPIAAVCVSFFLCDICLHQYRKSTYACLQNN